MKKWLITTYLFTVSFSLSGNESVNHKEITMEEINQSPQYLYKVLSLRNWQATQNRKTVQLSAEDDAFIHFSTEDQLERIIGKYWADAPQLVILKIDSNKLEGKLAFESNAGGSTQYYHLYNGFIPFNSILESKIVYQQSIDACDMQKLDIVQVGHPVLRQTARELSVEEILSPEIQDLIETMKATMRAAPGVGLAAPQIGKSLQLAVIEDMDHSHLNAQQLAERNRYPVPFHVIINPRIYIEESTDKPEFFEGCLSVPEFVGVVPRAESVRVECLNEQGKPVVIQAKGWYARILQHEIDHLNGTLYIDKAQLPTLMTAENYVKLHKDKSVKEIQSNLFLNNQWGQAGHSDI
ncbi:MAG: peptide deformylase [Simkaniaceae bacterium]|nr:peptide deformylase [Simkaniaceae bacterium]